MDGHIKEYGEAMAIYGSNSVVSLDNIGMAQEATADL